MKRVIGIIMFGAVVWMSILAVSAVQAAERKVEEAVSAAGIIENGVVAREVEVEDYAILRPPFRDIKVLYSYEIIVSFSDFMLHVFDRDGNEVFVAPVALPRHTPKLPVDGQLAAIQRNPYWYPTAKLKAYILKKEGIVYPDAVPPGPGNPMGKAKLSTVFSTPGSEQLSRIHGTNHPESIGKRASSGCIRMHNEDVIALCELLEPTLKAGGKVAVSYVKDFRGDE